jgi:glycosyltransferase involved in cell wall biosynthesis
MRICFIGNGSSVHIQRWLNYLAHEGHEVHLITPFVKEGYAEGVQTHLLLRLLPQIWRVSRYFSGLLWLAQTRKLVRTINPDILDAHFITVDGYLAVASGFHPLVLSAWGDDILIDPVKNFVYRFFTRQALRRADRIICISSALKEEVTKFGISPGMIDIVFIGTDTQKFSPNQRNADVLQNLGIPASCPVVISTRSLWPIYDIETLIKAIPLVLKEVPQARFIIGGQGEQRNYLVKLAKDLGIYDAIKFPGWIPPEDLPVYLASSAMYVSTSLSDGTSISLLEAMASGLTPVVTDIPANRPWVEDGQNGFLFPVKSHEILAVKIVYLLKNTDLRNKFGQANRRIIQEKAEFHKEMAKVEKTYLDLVAKAREESLGNHIS